MKRTVLLIDDNLEFLEVLKDELTEAYEVITTQNGQEAIDCLTHNSDIDIIVCDVMMPVMDGFEFCKIVKSNLEFNYVPVILLTAQNTLKSRITGLDLGADAYIEKPFDVEHLLVQIANLIANRDKLRMHFSLSAISNSKGLNHSSNDQSFLDKLNQAIFDNLDDQFLDVDKLANLMNTSRTGLFRKIKSLSDLTPNEIINIARLKRAAELLAETDLKIFEITYMVGYNSQTSFGRSFCKQFGMTPTEYQKLKKPGA